MDDLPTGSVPGERTVPIPMAATTDNDHNSEEDATHFNSDENAAHFNIFQNSSSFTDYARQLQAPKADVVFENAGIRCEIKHLDSVYDAHGQRIVLITGSKFNLQKDRPASTYETALLRTIRWDRSGEVQEAIELEIRSPHMKAALKAVVPEYAHESINTKHITILNEPMCLFHYRNELFQYGMELPEGSDAQAHVSLLLEYVNQELGSEMYAWTVMVEFEADLASCAVEFRNLWMAFAPGEHVFVADYGHSGQSIVLEFESMTVDCRCQKPHHVKDHAWSITGLCIDRNSSGYGYSRMTQKIKYFPGYKPLKDLRVVSLRFHLDAQRVREAHVRRGRRFTELQGKHHLLHKGMSTVLGRDRNYTMFGEEDNFPLQASWVSGRVMIDHQTFAEARPGHEMLFHSPTRQFAKKHARPEDFTDDELMICYYKVPGFALAEKKWGWFCVDNLSEIPFDGQAFSRDLVLPRHVKNIVSSLVQVHDSNKVTFDDVIAGKGKGMVFLLYGDPGTGKTLTAESVADHCKKPLLRIDSSMLGITAKSVETNLASAFHLAEKWKCVILIDEADVFLEQRTSSDLTRNSLVAVFLRVLEYYEGILFLTTNRLETFDRAFKSRVHLAIHFPKLDLDSRLSIWRTFLSRVSQSALESLTASGALVEFAAADLNGRQIKNVVRIAQARAVSEDQDISREFVDEALDAMKFFDREFHWSVEKKATVRYQPVEDGDEEGERCGRGKRRRLADEDMSPMSDGSVESFIQL